MPANNTVLPEYRIRGLTASLGVFCLVLWMASLMTLLFAIYGEYFIGRLFEEPNRTQLVIWISIFTLIIAGVGAAACGLKAWTFSKRVSALASGYATDIEKITNIKDRLEEELTEAKLEIGESQLRRRILKERIDLVGWYREFFEHNASEAALRIKKICKKLGVFDQAKSAIEQELEFLELYVKTIPGKDEYISEVVRNHLVDHCLIKGIEYQPSECIKEVVLQKANDLSDIGAEEIEATLEQSKSKGGNQVYFIENDMVHMEVMPSSARTGHSVMFKMLIKELIDNAHKYAQRVTDNKFNTVASVISISHEVVENSDGDQVDVYRFFNRGKYIDIDPFALGQKSSISTGLGFGLYRSAGIAKGMGMKLEQEYREQHTIASFIQINYHLLLTVKVMMKPDLNLDDNEGRNSIVTKTIIVSCKDAGRVVKQFTCEVTIQIEGDKVVITKDTDGKREKLAATRVNKNKQQPVIENILFKGGDIGSCTAVIFPESNLIDIKWKLKSLLKAEPVAVVHYGKEGWSKDRLIQIKKESGLDGQYRANSSRSRFMDEWFMSDRKSNPVLYIADISGPEFVLKVPRKKQ